MSKEKDTTNVVIIAHTQIPYNVISKDIPEYLKSDFYQELGEILDYYCTYKKGADFSIEGTNGDYVASDVKYKKAKDLIDKEARFLFAHTPDFFINKNTAKSEQEKAQATIANNFITKVFNSVGMSEKLVKAAKDCFIGKRVGCILNFHPELGISVTFLKSYEFIYEKDASERLTKFIAFYTVVDSTNKKEKQIKKKSYEMKDGVCYTHEVLYNGLGEEIEETVPETATLFEYIPAVVIINDGLSNDGKGESEIENLEDLEGLYSKLANSDIDAARKSMNAVRYTIDADAGSTSNLSTAPGAFWDIRSNPVTPDPKTAQVGMLEPSMSYSGPLKTTLDRVNNQMHSQVDVPDINSEQLQGVITSGKTLKALYWALIVRCDEKMLAWQPALIHIVKSLLQGAVYYPESAEDYTEETIPDIEYDIDVNNNYPLLEDDVEEKTMDLGEVQAMTMSRKAYMKKWRQLTDEEVDEELTQILLEKQMFEDAYVPSDMAENFTDMVPLMGGEEAGMGEAMTGEEPELTDEDVAADQAAKDDLLSQLDELLAELGG